VFVFEISIVLAFVVLKVSFFSLVQKVALLLMLIVLLVLISLLVLSLLLL